MSTFQSDQDIQMSSVNEFNEFESTREFELVVENL